MCPPQHFGVLYEINPWMHTEVRVDVDRARAQWERLRGQPRGRRGRGGDDGAGGARPRPRLHRQRRPRLRVHRSSRRTSATPSASPRPRCSPPGSKPPASTSPRLPDALDHEGAGDALPFFGAEGRAVLLSGYRPRSDAAAGTRALGPARTARCAPSSWSTSGCTTSISPSARSTTGTPSAPRWAGTPTAAKVVDDLVPEPLWLEDDEALSFCANSVVVDRNIVMPVVPPRVGAELERWGFTVVESPVDEFLKAGGGCRCLTLALDVHLTP